MIVSGRNGIAGLVLSLLALVVDSAAVAAASNLSLQLPGGQEFEIRHFAGSGKPLLLWLPSERGFGPAHDGHAADLAQAGFEVWLADMHGAYFIEPGRRSIAKFPLHDVTALIDAAVAASDRGVYLVSTSRGAQLALIAAREWQLLNPGRAGIKGVFLTHAYLYRERPAPGKSASYLPIVGATNLPVYLLDTQYSTCSARLGELARALDAGGSKVFKRILPGVQGGFFARDERELEPADMAARRDFAAIVEQGIVALALTPPPQRALQTVLDTREFSRHGRYAQALQPLAPAIPAPALDLADYDGTGYRLERDAAAVTLVNFWASWCKPCVKEIPSLQRLRESVPDAGFEIVTVNVGESRQRIDSFLARVPFDLPLLLDSDSQAAKDWKIYVYPSTYLLDHRGRIRYAYLGALEWDSAENISIIRKLLRRR